MTAPPAGVPRRAQLVSAPFGSGVAWLVNVLLELDVRMTHHGFQQDHWLDTESGEELRPEAFAHLRWHLPSLLERRSFTFLEELEVLWEHRLSFARSPARRTILFTRDPRDAVYSLYRRNYEGKLTFRRYLERPDVWPDHFPGLFGLPPAETWALFHLFWLAVSEVSPVLLVRFEDMRADALGQVRGVLEFLGLERDDAAIERALAASTFERARAGMEQLEEETGGTFRTARAGKVGEWEEAFAPEELAAFRGLAEVAMVELGYPELPEETPPPTSGIWQQDDLLERALPATRAALKLARQHYAEGDAARAEGILRASVDHAGSELHSRFAAAGMLVALRWTESVFSATRRVSRPAQIAFDHWTLLMHSFVEAPEIQRVLLGATDSEDPHSTEAAFRPGMYARTRTSKPATPAVATTDGRQPA